MAKKEKIKKVTSNNLTELRKSLIVAKKDLHQLILDNTQFKLKDNRQIFHKRKEIARTLTAIRQQELAS